MKLVLACLFISCALGARAQSVLDMIDENVAAAVRANIERLNNLDPSDELDSMSPRGFARLRFLDRLNGRVKDLALADGESIQEQQLSIALNSCYAPRDGSNSDAAAYLTIQDERDTLPAFQGWMIASSPALSALDHPRYDVWVVECNNERAQIDGNESTSGRPAPPARNVDQLNVLVIETEEVG